MSQMQPFKVSDNDHDTLMALVRGLNHFFDKLVPGGYLPEEGVLDSLNVAHNATIGGTLKVTGGASLGGLGPNYDTTSGYVQFAQIDFTKQYDLGCGVFQLIGTHVGALAATVFIRIYRQEAMSVSGFGASYRTIVAGDLHGWTASQIVGVLTSDTNSLKQIKFYVPVAAYAGVMVHPVNMYASITSNPTRVASLPAGTQYTATAV